MSSARTGNEGQSTSDVRLLLVDDDASVLNAYRRVLELHGMNVEAVSRGKTAIERLAEDRFDVVVSDLSMPEMTGLELLRAVRAVDADIPVVLMTGDPGLESAVQAVEYGAFRYLAKPVAPKILCEVVSLAARLHKMARLKRAALGLSNADGGRFGERAVLEVRFSRALERMWMAFQPIVGWNARDVFGFEALLRSDEPSMRNPGDILDAAERLDRIHDLGRAVRRHVASAASLAPPDVKLFVNLHSADLEDQELYDVDAPLTRFAGRVVLEMTERASLCNIKNVAGCITRLKDFGYTIAIDDLGAGYAGLTSFTQLEPQIVKLDMSLVRDVDTDPRRQSIVRSMKLLSDDLGMRVVAEGVETKGERDALAEIGCDLLQGYLFAKPGRGFATPSI